MSRRNDDEVFESVHDHDIANCQTVRGARLCGASDRSCHEPRITRYQVDVCCSSDFEHLWPNWVPSKSTRTASIHYEYMLAKKLPVHPPKPKLALCSGGIDNSLHGSLDLFTVMCAAMHNRYIVIQRNEAVHQIWSSRFGAADDKCFQEIYSASRYNLLKQQKTRRMRPLITRLQKAVWAIPKTSEIPYPGFCAVIRPS